MACANAQAPLFATATATTVAKAFGSNVTAGNLIAVVSVAPTTVTHVLSSVTDSLSNTYTTAIGPIDQASLLYRVYISYAKNISGGACTVTSTWDTSGYHLIIIYEFSGCDTASPLIDTTSATGNVSAINAGTLDPTTANSALLCFCAEGTASPTAGSGWTKDIASNSFQYDGTESQFPTSSGAYAANWATPDPSAFWIAVAAAFQEAAAASNTFAFAYGATPRGLPRMVPSGPSVN